MGFLDNFFSGNTLYYPGCLSKFARKDLVENYKQILSWEGIDFIMLEDGEVCCGSPIKNAGAKDDFLSLARKNLQVFKDHGIKTIISNCPSCVAVFRLDYAEILGDEWNIEVKHVTEIMNKSLEKIKKFDGEIVTYHDSCHLGKALGNYEKPREIIKRAGFKLKEMTYNRRDSLCCGGGGGVNTNNPSLAGDIAADRIEQAVETQAKILITACPMCKAHLANNQGGKIEVLEISELFNYEKIK